MPNINFYRCKTCGNIMALLLKGGATRTCCGQFMTKLEPNATDGSKEEHIPVITRENGKLQVTVGSTLHPMLPKHYIELICSDTGMETEIVYFKSGMEPRAEFADVGSSTVYEYCSVHGLWKTEF